MQPMREKKFMCEKKSTQQNATTFLSLALLVAPTILFAGGNLSAQTVAPQAKESQQQTAAAKPAPLASPAPAWPANQPPTPAIVRWDSRGLQIEASNSSLDQILRQVAAQTGAKLQGLTQDQRIFGSYGPGPEGDVLSKLLEGSGYNVLIFGSHDTGSHAADLPLEIVLSARPPASPQVAADTRNRSYAQASKPLEPDPRRNDPSGAPAPQANQDPYNVGGPARDPVQMMQEILQRQQVIDQQQQQDQRR